MPEVYEIKYISQHSPCEELRRYVELSNKDGLEIGGNSNCIAANFFIQAGARSVIVSGQADIKSDHASPDPKIQLASANALELVDNFGRERFDFVYGISIMEHIPTPEKLFHEIYTVLKPGGLAYLQGSPLWASAHGHHIWLSNWINNTKKTYHFIPYPGSGGYNPIPDWGHLLFSPDELTTYLTQLDVPSEDIPVIIKAIYENDGLNKESASSIMAAATRSKFIIMNAAVHRHVIPQHVLDILRTKYPNKIEDWSVHGIALVVMKPLI